MPLRLNTRRPGYTLIELMVAMGTSAILMGGLASALCISTQALAPDESASDEDNRSSLALAQVTSDLRLALSFSERTAQAVTFTAPDRNNDAQVETIRYSWTGVAGNPLLYEYNGASAVAIADGVQQFNVAALVRTIPADPLPVLPASVKYESFAEAATSSSGATSLTIAAPSGTVAGELLIAAIAADGDFGATLTDPAGWSLLTRSEYNLQIGLAVWWKVAAASEPSATATWSNSRRAYGWIMRFSGAEPTAPAFLANAGNSPTVESLALTTTVNNAMALRIAAVKGNNMTGGPSFHTLITQDANGSDVEAAAAYRLLPAAGTTGTATFGHTGAANFSAFTVVIIPDDGT